MLMYMGIERALALDMAAWMERREFERWLRPDPFEWRRRMRALVGERLRNDLERRFSWTR
jgi:hypothetical protein